MKLAVCALGCSFAVLLTALTLAPAASGTPAAPGAAANTPVSAAGWPAGPGLSLILQKCSACHAPAMVKSERHDAAGWDDVIDLMVSRGAQVSDTEQHTIGDYLAKNFGPAAKAKK
jgi:cytochrome c5